MLPPAARCANDDSVTHAPDIIPGDANPSLLASLGIALRDIKLAHSVFALPFALAGAVLVAHRAGTGVDWGRFSGQLALVIICMVFARTWAMLINRVADHRLDADNPRTARRAVASGALPVGRAWTFAGVSTLAFVLCCAGFWVFFGNPWPLILSVPVLGWIALYSYTKRFTALCHLFLGGALAVSPLAAGIAIGGPEGLIANLAPLGAMACFVMLWVAGFDVAYALQDLDFDRERALRSIPAALGWRGALWVSRGLHLLALGALACVPLSDPRLGVFTWTGVALTAALLAWEHRVLHARGLAGLPMAFFTINGVVSLLLGALLTLDTLV